MERGKPGVGGGTHGRRRLTTKVTKFHEKGGLAVTMTGGAAIDRGEDNDYKDKKPSSHLIVVRNRNCPRNLISL